MAGVDVTRIADCPVCLARFQDPRVLPCGHTFCLYCIKWHGICKGSDCPVCRARFHIPSNGWEGLPKNYSLNSVLGENAVGTTKSKVTKRSCAKHPDEELVLYCMHCDVVICLDCMEDHWRHDMRSISRFAKQARMTLEDYVMSIQLIWSLVTNQKSEVEEKSKKFCDLLDETELAINEEREKKKRILDDHRRLLLEELSNEKQKVMKDTKMKTDEIEAEQLRLASFKARIEVLLQGSDEARTFDMVSKYKDFKESFDKLKEIQLQASRPTRGIKLIPGDCKELIEKANKIMIGSLQMESDCGGRRTREQIKVPAALTGLIIGKGGGNINRIRIDSGANVKVSDPTGDVDNPMTTVTITGTPSQIQRAQHLVETTVKETVY